MFFCNKHKLPVQLNYNKIGREALRKFDTRTKNEILQDVNGTLAAQTTNEGTVYFSTDLLGSVSNITDTYGSEKSGYTYDAFGTLVQGNLNDTSDFGYLGKQQDPTSLLYNYGYRDYKSQNACFTTVDPIRDGVNWFVYCSGDPVNNIDSDGLSALTTTLRVIATGIIKHYGRNNNQKSETYINKDEAIRKGYRQLGEDKGIEKAEDLDRYHEMGKLPKGYNDPSGNDKYIKKDPNNPNASCELVFDKSGKLVTDSINKGTYNYWTPGDDILSNIMHGICDVLPYYLLGNNITDFKTTNIIERILGNYTGDIPDPSPNDKSD